jgi:hypothetical protein
MNNGMTATSSYRSNRSNRLRRPGFMEPLGGGYVGDGGMRRSRSFPIQDDAGYIGYLSDDESGGGGEGIMSMMVTRRRRELLGIDGDISFSMCCLLVVMVMMVALVLVWGGLRTAS